MKKEQTSFSPGLTPVAAHCVCLNCSNARSSENPEELAKYLLPKSQVLQTGKQILFVWLVRCGSRRCLSYG